MGKASRDKGKVGEREVVNLLKAWGFEARRGQQFKGTKDSPDIIHNIYGLDIEVKRRETLKTLYDWLHQADEDGENTACVFSRMNNKPWLITFNAEEFFTWMDDMDLLGRIEGEWDE